jgi:hypothetical protein
MSPQGGRFSCVRLTSAACSTTPGPKPRRGSLSGRLHRRRRDGGRAAFSENENLDALRVVTDDEIVTAENAEQNLSQGTRKASVNDFVERRGRTTMQISLLAKGLKNMAHGVALDPHLHFVATAVNHDLGVRAWRRKSPQTDERHRTEIAKSVGMGRAGPETPGVSRGRRDSQSQPSSVSRGVCIRKNGAGQRGVAPAARRCA